MTEQIPKIPRHWPDVIWMGSFCVQRVSLKKQVDLISCKGPVSYPFISLETYFSWIRRTPFDNKLIINLFNSLWSGILIQQHFCRFKCQWWTFLSYGFESKKVLGSLLYDNFQFFISFNTLVTWHTHQCFFVLVTSGLVLSHRLA